MDRKHAAQVWDLPTQAEIQQATALAATLDLPLTAAQVLVRRGMADADAATAFLDVGDDDLADPFLLAECGDAARRILTAIERQEKIVVHGDYDADGILDGEDGDGLAPIADVRDELRDQAGLAGSRRSGHPDDDRPLGTAGALRIAERCQFDLGQLRYRYPHELVPAGHNATSWLRKLVEEGARWRWPDSTLMPAFSTRPPPSLNM